MLEVPETESKVKKTVVIIGVISLVALLLWGVTASLDTLANDRAQSSIVVTTEQGDVIQTVGAYGRLQARHSSSLIAEVDGVIADIVRFPGTAVEPGDTVIILENPQLQRDLEQAQLSVLEAKANLELVEAALEEQRIVLLNELEMITTEISLSQKELDTKKFLSEQGLVTQLDFLRSETNLKKSKLSHSLLQRRITALEKTEVAERNMALYKLQEADKRLELVNQDLAHLQVTAKRNGLLSNLHDDIKIGNPVTRGQVLAQVTDPDNLYAELLMSANDSQLVSSGQEVLLNIRDETVHGSVLRIFPTAENNQVRLDVKLPQKLPPIARANLDVSAKIIVAQLESVIKVKKPTDGLKQGSLNQLFVRNNDKFIKRDVQFGLVGDSNVQVLSGLDVGDEVLLTTNPELIKQSEISVDDVQDE
ncbi:HlyD family secretion protein [Pseudidiomarina maritima]|jgi:hypothetical protein|uniref:HlyD family secretion protein n=1 Tax=Pseudidiomarina maritima TaxID=519453 RepID=A0A1I6GVC0_9GAMM|nr:HlyD family efflux transporter periplasmic adaptor subunit [Pseudidiomarina maritima]SFR46128.1 HlyD family secretion protein [Pseudidiomarina maritima]